MSSSYSMDNKENHIQPMAASPTTAAAMAKPISRPLTVFFADDAGGRGAGAAERAAGAGAATPAEEGGRATAAPLAPEVGGTGGAGEAEAGRAGAGAAGAAAAEGGGALGAADGGGGPPAGRLGNLMVADEEGLGGRLMRTVSFLGWTLAASPGLGGTGPAGMFGVFSAIETVRSN